jgi:hypothetical protein
MLFLGGIVFLFIDRLGARGTDEQAEQTDVLQTSSFTIGVWQCLAMVPGVSRSAATIIGGMTQGFNRKNAAEFSFFLAVPTMFAATVKSIYDYIEGWWRYHHRAFPTFRHRQRGRLHRCHHRHPFLHHLPHEARLQGLRLVPHRGGGVIIALHLAGVSMQMM